MDIQLLKQEISQAQYSNLSPTAICATLNDPVQIEQGEISIQQLLLWAGKYQALRRLRTLINTGLEPVASVAEVALRLLDLGLPLDPNMNEVGEMLQALTGADLFTESEIGDLLRRGQRQISRADQLGLGFVFEQNVIDALHV